MITPLCAASLQMPSQIRSTPVVQVPHRRHLRREHPVRLESGLPRAHHPAHCWQRVRAHHGCAGCLQEQDGPGHWGGSGVFHPDCHLRVACAGPHWVCLPSHACYAVSSAPACALSSCLWGCACHAVGAVLAMPWDCAYNNITPAPLWI